MSKIMRWLMAGLVLMVLSGCGGGGDNSISPENKKTEVKFDIKDLNIKLNEGYKIVSEDKSIDLSSSGEIEVDFDINTTVPLIVSNNEGTPILLGRKLAGESKVELSVESTAEIFILRTTAFFGKQIKNDKELSLRIRAHKDFPRLVKEIKESINDGSTCPTDPNCNPVYMIMASKITSSLDIKDLVGDK